MLNSVKCVFVWKRNVCECEIMFVLFHAHSDDVVTIKRRIVWLNFDLMMMLLLHNRLMILMHRRMCQLLMLLLLHHICDRFMLLFQQRLCDRITILLFHNMCEVSILLLLHHACDQLCYSTTTHATDWLCCCYWKSCTMHWVQEKFFIQTLRRMN